MADHVRIVDWLCDNWDRPDEGIWETRGGQKDFVYGRVMSWVAIRPGLRISERRGRPADVDRWRDAGTGSTSRSWRRVGSKERAAFVQHYGRTSWTPRCSTCRSSASSSPRDPMWLSTLRRDGRGARLGQPRLPLRSQRLPGRPSRLGGNLLDLHVLVRRRAGALRPARKGTTDVREDAHLREPCRAVLRGDRARPASSWATSLRRSGISR